MKVIYDKDEQRVPIKMWTDNALALLETLIDWAESYEGEGTVNKILNKVRKTYTNE
jgi:hypothetical protein